MYKTIQITLPFDEKISEKILQYTPEENNCILEIGINCYDKAKKDAINITETENIKKINTEYNKKIEKFEREIFNEKECRNYIIESLKKVYEDEKNSLIKKNEKLENELKVLKKEREVDELILQKEIEKAVEYQKEKFRLIIDEKNKIMERYEKDIERERKLKEDTSKILKYFEEKNNYSSLKQKGDVGEMIFNELSDEAFGEIDGYELKDTSKIKHSGDFHLHFKDFGVLVDLKNYDTIVPIKEIKKIESDFTKNTHLNFAWLISLNTRIQCNDKGVITYKLLDDGRCIFYVNELLKQTNQLKVIKSLYYFCKMINVFIEDNKVDEEENKTFKKNYREVIEEVKLFKKDLCELNTTINTFQSIYDRIKYKINNILRREIDNIIEESEKIEYDDIFNDWFYTNYEIFESDKTIKSKELWSKFKRDNTEIENPTVDKFKEIIYKNISEDNLILPKNKKGGIEIKNYREKKLNVVTDEEEVYLTSKEENLKIIIDRVERKKKEKVTELFLDEDKKKILDLYGSELKDIMEIKDIMGLKEDDVYKIVSLLVNEHVISLRSEARGYEKYKETETYKSKLIKKNNITIIDNKKNKM